MLIVGETLSTTNVALGPAAGAKLPALSVAVPAAMVIPKVPSPVIELMVTVRLLPVPVTAIIPEAVLVVFRVMFAGIRVLVLKPVARVSV